ncbi:RICIN domain-containing protein [Stigmatella aurantiaca]|uniref:Subtilisin-like serine protease n=2 Tax=Stigmatella aurantiaca (strain DW4/3-1) TaxID=378806 RepID=E3FRN8_STIAD|nr:RICIN domain-containing protein [Stigmatella aurantiaca]ADO75815.1 Subtilisin-like serine protease [Stigmatella aurantiaca DW4/3-1]
MGLRLSLLCLACVALGACASESGPLASEATVRLVTSRGLLRTGGEWVPGQYIVVLKEPMPGAELLSVEELARALAVRHGVTVERTYAHALRGFLVRAPETQARQLASDPAVKYVVEDGLAYPDAVQANLTWGLDRIGQQDLPLNGVYTYNFSGKGVHVYVIDTGIRATHAEFGGRVSLDYSGVSDGNGAGDCHGHGTHVAGTLGGATWGVAKGVSLHSVRVFGCSGGAEWSTIIGAVDWVTAHHLKPAVANMSLSGGANQAVDDAVRNSIAAGVVYTVAAGNQNANACAFSPARLAEALTVGATDRADHRAAFSNQGPCLDLFAPGTGVTSAWYSSDTVTSTLSGTSMAAPHVAGTAALFLEFNPTADPSLVAQALTGYASVGKVQNPGAGSPNRLLFSNPHITTPMGIIARHSAQCLDVVGGSAEAGAELMQSVCHTGPSQRFRVEPDASGDYRIVAQHSGQCLDAVNGSSEQPAALVQNPCHGGDSQRFALFAMDDGFYRITVKHSGQCLDIAGGTAAPGNPLTQRPCHAGPSQQFKLN